MWLCVGGGLGEGTVLQPGFWRFAQHSPHFQSLHPLPICNWHPSSCCAGVESQSGYVCYVLRPCGSFKQSLLKVQQLLPCPKPTGFYNQKLWGFISLVMEPWAVQSGLGLGSLTPKFSPPISIHHMPMWDHPFHYHSRPLSALHCICSPLRPSR